MSYRDKSFDTTTTLLAWLIELATHQSSTRFQIYSYRLTRRDEDRVALRDDNGRIIEDTFYKLQEKGGYRAASHAIPTEAGQLLEGLWATGDYGQVVNYRGAPRLLKDLGSNVNVAKLVREAKAAAEVKAQRQSLERSMKATEDFIAANGTWLAIETKVALEREMDNLVSALVALDDGQVVA